MNSYALSLGMSETHFMNPHGLDQAGHYTSAYDLALSGWYALRNPLLMQFAQFKSGIVDHHSFYNVNSFLSRYPGATGIKPGWTDDAGRVLVASAHNYGHNIIVVVMNSTIEIAKDVDPLMDYGFTLLNGQAEIPLQSVNLGSLNIPGVAKAAQPTKSLNLQALSAALKAEVLYTLQLAVSLAPH
jgi:D-alanyl-D-alanine carboxypeptidase